MGYESRTAIQYDSGVGHIGPIRAYGIWPMPVHVPLPRGALVARSAYLSRDQILEIHWTPFLLEKFRRLSAERRMIYTS